MADHLPKPDVGYPPILPDSPENPVMNRITLICGLLSLLVGMLGIIQPVMMAESLSSLIPLYLPMAFSTALIWVFFGVVLMYYSVQRDRANIRIFLEAVLIIIVMLEALELPFNILGSRSVVGSSYTPTMVSLPGQQSTPFFPVAPILIIVTALSLIILLNSEGIHDEYRRIRDGLGLTGGLLVMVSLTFILGYLYGAALLYATPFIPVGLSSALAALFIGTGLIMASGPSAIPNRYFIGNTTRARLLRTFIPLVFLIFLIDNITDVVITSVFNIQGSLVFAISGVFFSLVASYAFARLSEGLSIRLEIEAQKRKQTENALVEANKKLNLLNSITRHDILNQLVVIDGYLELSREECTDPKLRDYFDRVIKSTKMIERQISFTKFYQELGVQSPVWHAVHDVVESVANMAGFENLRIISETESLEIFADPLFEKVFYNIFDNAVRHGEHVTEIRIRFEERLDTGVLIVEDNGVGVVDSEKTKIFRRGFGKHTGFGLFLTREILAITGISIIENGEPGKGARFEIIVPKSDFRFPEKT